MWNQCQSNWARRSRWMTFAEIRTASVPGCQALYQVLNSMHRDVRWSKPVMIATQGSHLRDVGIDAVLSLLDRTDPGATGQLKTGLARYRGERIGLNRSAGGSLGRRNALRDG
jgi:hypothetical protein